MWRRLRSGRRSWLAAGLFEHRLLKPLLERCDWDAADDLGAEGISQQVARDAIGQPTALQIKHFLAVELADGRAMRAFHIVGEISSCGLVSTWALPVSSRLRLDCTESVRCAPWRTMISLAAPDGPRARRARVIARQGARGGPA